MTSSQMLCQGDNIYVSYQSPDPSIGDNYIYGFAKYIDVYNGNTNIPYDNKYISFEKFYKGEFNKFHQICSIRIEYCSARCIRELCKMRDDFTSLINVSITILNKTVPPIHINTKTLYLHVKKCKYGIGPIKGDINCLYISNIMYDIPINKDVIQCNPTTLKLYCGNASKHLNDLYVPDSVINLRIYNSNWAPLTNYIKLPKALKHINIYMGTDTPNTTSSKTPYINPINLSLLPRNLESLIIHHSNHTATPIHIYGKLPLTITNLWYGRYGALIKKQNTDGTIEYVSTKDKIFAIVNGKYHDVTNKEYRDNYNEIKSQHIHNTGSISTDGPDCQKARDHIKFVNDLADTY